MKKYLLLSLLLICLGAAKAQDNYFVTVIKGDVSRADGSRISNGAKIQLTEKLVFGGREALLILLHPSKGRFILSPAKAPASKSKSFTVLVKDYLQIHAQNQRLSSRALDDEFISLEDRFKTDSSINSKLLIIDTLRTRLPGPEFRGIDNEENFFFLQLVATKPVNHKLSVEDNSLMITLADIIFNDKLYNKSDGQLNLGFIRNYSTDKKTKLVSVIEPAYMSSEECTSIIKGIKTSLKGKPEKEILKEIYTQLYYIYGKPDQLIIEQLYHNLK